LPSKRDIARFCSKQGFIAAEKRSVKKCNKLLADLLKRTQDTLVVPQPKEHATAADWRSLKKDLTIYWYTKSKSLGISSIIWSWKDEVVQKGITTLASKLL